MELALKEALLAVPPASLRDLLLCGACTLCCLRFLNVRSRVYLSSAPSPVSVLKELQPAWSTESQHVETAAAAGDEICTICLGVLQCESLVESGVSKAAEEYDSESFCMEVTVPPATFVRERSLWCYMQEKHGACNGFTAEDPTECIVSLKEAVKWVFGPQLETKLRKTFDKNSKLRISLVFKHLNSNSEVHFLSDLSVTDSKRKRGSENGESIAAVQRSLASLSSKSFAEHYPCPPAKVDTSSEVLVTCRRDATLIVGRYLKYSRNISQSPWTINDERKGEGSVQEIIADAVVPHFKADSHKFHSAGREDIDVRMLGSGRPFILEIVNARTCPTQAELVTLEDYINSNKATWVNVNGLKEAGNEAWAFMLEGEADKQKEYAAVVWLSRPFTEADFVTLNSTKELEIQQKTPIRVLHRRSPLVRPRTIHWMRCETLHDSKQYFILHLCSQAGTYIKEFVHGDLGRTYPNVGSILNCEADILFLDVTNVKMDFV